MKVTIHTENASVHYNQNGSIEFRIVYIVDYDGREWLAHDFEKAMGIAEAIAEANETEIEECFYLVD